MALKKENLVEGKNYRTEGRLFSAVVRFDKVTKNNVVISTPMSDSPYLLYNELHEKEDPDCKAGTIGMSLESFLKSFSELEE